MTVLNLQNEGQSKNEPQTSGGDYFTPYNVGMDRMNKNEVERLVYASNSLPKNLRLVLVRHESAEYIEENLGPAFNLTLEQKEEAARVIRDVVLADLFIGDMVSRLSVEGKMDESKARDVANHIVNNLFKPVLEELKEVQRDRFGTSASQISAEKPGGQAEVPAVEQSSPRGTAQNIPNQEESQGPSLTPSEPSPETPNELPSLTKPAPQTENPKPPGPESQGPSLAPTIGLREIQDAARKEPPSSSALKPSESTAMPGIKQPEKEEPKKYNVIDLKSL